MNAARFALAPLFLLAVACSGTAEAPKDQASTAAPLTAAERDQAFLTRFDANKDGKLQVAELPERMREHLAAADSDKDGILSTAELAAGRQKRQDEHFARLDPDGDGKVTLASLPTDLPPPVRERLASADTDKDGVVTRAEFAALPPREHGFRGGPPGERSAKGFHGGHGDFLKKLDSNGDGNVSVAELPKDLPEGFRAHLLAADTNKDGILSKEELSAARPPRGEHEKPTYEGFLSRFDANKDGKVTVAELPTTLPERFRADLTAADTDKDGTLSKAEMEALHTKHMADHPKRGGPGGRGDHPGFDGPDGEQR